MSADLLGRSGVQRWLKEVLYEYRPRPHTGYLWLDIIYLFLLASLEASLLKSMSGPFVMFDLITPWLVLSIIQKTRGPATILALVAAMIQEAQSSVPAGTFICIYWIVANVIIQVRPALSWRNISSWLAVFFISSFATIIFQVGMIFLLAEMTNLSLYFWLSLLVRQVTSVIFGLILCRKWLAFDAEEPVPP